VALEDILLNPSIGNMLVLPGGAPVRNTSELMRSPRMASLVGELRARYADRLVVFDMPAILSGADALAFSNYIDATILIAEERRTTAAEIARSCNLLEHANLIGVVLNKSRAIPIGGNAEEDKPGFFGRLFR
jgi:protein-tyrosine kinase